MVKVLAVQAEGLEICFPKPKQMPDGCGSLLVIPAAEGRDWNPRSTRLERPAMSTGSGFKERAVPC